MEVKTLAIGLDLEFELRVIWDFDKGSRDQPKEEYLDIVALSARVDGVELPGEIVENLMNIKAIRECVYEKVQEYSKDSDL